MTEVTREPRSTPPDAIDQLLAARPYGLDTAAKSALLLRALHDSYRHHFMDCDAFQRYCARRGLHADSAFERVEDFPFLPVQAFKENFDLLRSTDLSKVKVKLQSSATSGVPSTVLVDGVTAQRQVRALASVIGEVLGPKRRPFLVLDVDPRGPDAKAMGARGAAVRGFLNLAREASYYMESPDGASLKLREAAFLEALERAGTKGEPVVILGFTYVLYLSAVAHLNAMGRTVKLPVGSFVVHIGGWKKLESQKVDKAAFNRSAAQVFGIPEDHVIDFYGFTEQMGVTYPDNPAGNKRAPAFAEVVVRDPVTLRPLPDGQVGVLQFLSPVPHSYPGFSVLTDDLGTVVSRGSDGTGAHGTEFRVLGRAKTAEVRGCGDIMGDKVAAVGTRPKDASTGVWKGKPRLLFGPDRTPLETRDPFASVAAESLPEVKDLGALAKNLRDGRALLDAYSVDELAALIGEAARRWALPDNPLAPLRQQGLLFLTAWCRSLALRTTADRSLKGGRGVLDGFRNVDGRLMTARPRGLVGHWLSGNVPLLGMLTLAQSILARNANLLKAASQFSSILPLLLETFRDLEVRTASGKVLRGNDVLKSIAVIYYPKEDMATAETFSSLADVRLAWGGREAVEAVMNLPRRYGTEDLIFGPKLSYMAIGKEFLSDDRRLRRTARLAAVDASVFDQYACASAHTIFVEKGGAASPKEFAERLAREMAGAAIRIPKQPPDAGTIGRIQSLRMRYEFRGTLWTSPGTEWTVLYDDDGGTALPEPCYSRVVTVRAVDDVLQASAFAHPGIQTIGLAIEGARRLEFAQAASSRGAERFPEVGRMTYFDSPWDGVFPLERMVRWVSLGGPS